MPLRQTISRLTRENNELHSRMIKQAEEGDASLGSLRKGAGHLQGQLDDLRFLSAQKDTAIAEQR